MIAVLTKRDAPPEVPHPPGPLTGPIILRDILAVDDVVYLADVIFLVVPLLVVHRLKGNRRKFGGCVRLCSPPSRLRRFISTRNHRDSALDSELDGWDADLRASSLERPLSTVQSL
jgi:hypothetical protein